MNEEMTTNLCAGDGAGAMPPIPPSLKLRKVASLCRIEVICSSVRTSILVGKVRR